eukprot:scaffold24022_cov28-Tisochrysis_lutea.AAC.3
MPLPLAPQWSSSPSQPSPALAPHESDVPLTRELGAACDFALPVESPRGPPDWAPAARILPRATPASSRTLPAVSSSPNPPNPPNPSKAPPAALSPPDPPRDERARCARSDEASNVTASSTTARARPHSPRPAESIEPATALKPSPCWLESLLLPTPSDVRCSGELSPRAAAERCARSRCALKVVASSSLPRAAAAARLARSATEPRVSEERTASTAEPRAGIAADLALASADRAVPKPEPSEAISASSPSGSFDEYGCEPNPCICFPTAGEEPLLEVAEPPNLPLAPCWG